MKSKRLFISLTLGLGLILALLWLLGGALPVYADPDILYVATDGSDANDCSTIPNRCRTVQRAVDLAVVDDEIWVAGGVYTDTDTASLGYVVALTKTVVLRGGWDASFTAQDFASNPTTLDAQGQGRVLFITGDISPTVEGLRITGGDAAGLGGGPGGDDAGGGVYVIAATATISGNRAFSNTADYGGGLYLNRSDAATLSADTISDNTANYGGGLYLNRSDAALSANTISDNTADYGGGLFLDSSDATLTNNIVTDNQTNGEGSGLYILASSPRLLHTTIARNSDGSGVHVTQAGPYHSTAALTNTILVSHTVGVTVMENNTAILESTLWGSGPWANGADTDGDGIIITGTNNYTGDPTFVDPDSGNYYIGAASAAIDKGVYAGVTVDIHGESRLIDTPDLGADEFLATLSVTKEADPDPVQAGAQLTYIIHVTNTSNVDLNATITDTLPAQVTTTQPLTWTTEITAPGGVWTQQVVVTVEMSYAGTLTNVVEVTTEEGATDVYTETSEAQVTPELEVTKEADPDPVQAGAQLTYTIRVTNTGNVDLNATITDTLPAQVTPTGPLTWTTEITAPGGVWTRQVVVTVEIGYAGTLTNVVEVTTEEGATDVYTETSEARVTPELEVTKEADPDPVQAGAQLTYTIRVTNTGNVDLNATITDTLPAQVTPTGPLTWTTEITAPGGVWTRQVVVTVEIGYAGTLTNVVEVTTEEGATDVYTETSEARVTPELEVTKEADPDPVQAGAQLTYTIRVTNTGNVDLNATITDTLPAQVTPTGPLTWATEITAPGGVWTRQVVVTVEIGYAGTLTNVVEVTTEEGATGVYTETSEAQVTPMLEVTKEADPDPVQAGAQLTYTIYVTNTGNVDLHATVTDTLPDQVWPTGVLTWTSPAIAPDSVWAEQFTVTVQMGYSGTLTNVVEVTTEEGATGVYTETSEARVTPMLEVSKEADPDPVQAGAQLTYTISVTNTGNVALTATVTDTLPAQVSPTGVLTWTPPAIAPDSVWVKQFTVTVQLGYSGTLTNVVEVTTEEGATGVYTETSEARVTPMLEVTKEADPDPVQAGAQLTYTISVTNTGNVALTATVTDTLPAQVSPTGVLTWTPVITAPDGVWTQQVVVTVEMSYSGTLTNVVEVTTEEGTTGVYTETSQARVTPMLEVTKEADPDPVQAGAQLTYTISVTNTGNVTLTATVTDTLPDQVLPTGVLTWTPPAIAPDRAWVEQFTVTVQMGYAGTLTNVVEVTTDEGAMGTDTCTVTVEEAIAGLAATNDSPTPLGSATTLTATITAGTNVVYTWAFGYDVPTGSGAVVTHTYPAVGVYTAVVTASNPVSVRTVTTTVPITDVPIAGLVATNDSPTVLGQATTLMATITAGSNVVYTWAFGDGDPGSGAVVAHTYPTTGTYTAVVTASNSVSVVPATTVTIIKASKLYLPIIMKNYTPPFIPPTETPTPTATGTLPPTDTPTPTATPTPIGPDLVVTDISVVPNPPEAGQSAMVYVTVKNQGNRPVADDNNFYVDFYVDREPAPLLRGDIEWGVQFSWFGVGESHTLSGSYTFTEGTHQLYAQADTDETVTESNENNNVLGPVPLDVTSLGGGETPAGPAVILTPGVGSPRPTPTPGP